MIGVLLVTGILIGASIIFGAWFVAYITAPTEKQEEEDICHT